MSRLARALGLTLALTAGAVSAQGFDQTHAAWSALLKKHVVLISDGRASQRDYAGMAKDHAALEAYLQALSGVPQVAFERWPKAQRMAFLINAYNAFTVEKILKRYPDIESIWDFGKIFGNPFKDEFFSLFGRPFSLDGIEHGMLASIGCPMLREEAYVAARLDAQLEEQAVRFLSDRSRNRYDPAQGALAVSKIFDWFKEDWQRGYRGFDGKTPPIASRAEYFARYAALLADAPADQARIREGRAPLGFLEYDWRLNDVKR